MADLTPAIRVPGRGAIINSMAASKKKAPRDVNVNAKRIFDEMVERSERPPHRGNLKAVEPTPAKKNGATK